MGAGGIEGGVSEGSGVQRSHSRSCSSTSRTRRSQGVEQVKSTSSSASAHGRMSLNLVGMWDRRDLGSEAKPRHASSQTSTVAMNGNSLVSRR